MNAEDSEAMRALDDRLRKLFSALDARPGFEDRLQARVAALAAAQHAVPVAELRRRLELEHERARAAAGRAARLDAVAVAVVGLGSVVGIWRFAPELERIVQATVTGTGSLAVAAGTLAVTGVALWALLRHFHVDPRRLVGA
jgi:hypothetical protein